MGIYIKGEEMPETCSKCKLFCNEYMLCGVTGFPFRSQEMYERRMYDCPLVSVPPHGALMDRDDFFATCPELVDGYKTITDELIVLPAEEGET